MTHPLSTYLFHHPKKTIIFDLDKTLIKLDIDWSGVFAMLVDTIQNLYPNNHVQPPRNSHEFYTLYSDYVMHGGAPVKETLDRAIETYETTHYYGYTPNNALLDFISSHTSSFTFALWTSNTRGAIADFLTKESLKTTFSTIVTINDVHRAKPYPDGFTSIYDGKQSKSNYLMVGDRSIDLQAAQNAGIDYFQEEYFNS